MARTRRVPLPALSDAPAPAGPHAVAGVRMGVRVHDGAPYANVELLEAGGKVVGAAARRIDPADPWSAVRASTRSLLHAYRVPRSAVAEGLQLTEAFLATMPGDAVARAKGAW